MTVVCYSEGVYAGKIRPNQAALQGFIVVGDGDGDGGGDGDTDNDCDKEENGGDDGIDDDGVRCRRCTTRTAQPRASTSTWPPPALSAAGETAPSCGARCR